MTNPESFESATNSITDWELAEETLALSSVFRVTYLYGPAGIGKTYTAMRAGLNGRGVYALTLTQETPSDEVRGHYLPTEAGGLAWHDGVLIRAMREGARVVINEISHASNDVESFLYPVLESPETAAVTLPTGETVRPAEGFNVVLTDNFPPDQLKAALRDRFDSVLHIAQPHPKAVEQIDDRFRPMAVKLFAADLGHDDDRRVSIRGWLRLQAASKAMQSDARAFAACFGRAKGGRLYDAWLLMQAK